MAFFRDNEPKVRGNTRLRAPQCESFEAVEQAIASGTPPFEFAVILPVGCGKTGCMMIEPFAFKARRTLIVAPNLGIAEQVLGNATASDARYFLGRTEVTDGVNIPEPAELRTGSGNKADLDAADIVVTNIQQLQGLDNKWLAQLPTDFFDLILVDEGHHGAADSWLKLRSHFAGASVIYYSATPMRSDGRAMPGERVYVFPVARAIREGYVKRIMAHQLNPTTLKYIEEGDEREQTLTLEEVISRGEESASFRRAVVQSKDSLDSIVNAALDALDSIRTKSNDERHKIIVSALNHRHCIQIVEAFRAKGRRADFVHSNESSDANAAVRRKLENHELDVIVQVRLLGEGFDHPYLSVACVCSVFSNLSPFVQFVGRIMRLVVSDDPAHPSNQGVVVYHAGGNIASQWSDFREFSEADKQFLDNLLPIQGVESRDWSGSEQKRVYDPLGDYGNLGSHVSAQGDVYAAELDLIDDRAAEELVEKLVSGGINKDEIESLFRKVSSRPETKQKRRQSKRQKLNDLAKSAARTILSDLNMPFEGLKLDKQFRGRSNYEVVIAQINTKISDATSHKERSQLSLEELEAIERDFPSILNEVCRELKEGDYA